MLHAENMQLNVIDNVPDKPEICLKRTISGLILKLFNKNIIDNVSDKPELQTPC